MISRVNRATLLGMSDPRGGCTVPQAGGACTEDEAGPNLLVSERPHQPKDDQVVSRVTGVNPATLLAMPNPHGGCTVPQAGEASIGDEAGPNTLVSDRPPRQIHPHLYTSGTAKKVAKAERRAAGDSETQAHLIRISPSAEIYSTKPLLRLPIHGRRSIHRITTQGGVPQFIVANHSFATQPNTIFSTLSEIVSDLYQMALNRPDNKSNTNRLTGSMRGIGFRQGSDYKKSGGKSSIIQLIFISPS